MDSAPYDGSKVRLSNLVMRSNNMDEFTETVGHFGTYFSRATNKSYPSRWVTEQGQLMQPDYWAPLN